MSRDDRNSGGDERKMTKIDGDNSGGEYWC